MRVLFFGLLTMFFFACSCSAKQSLLQKPTYPDKDLKEIRIRGTYVPEDKERVKELKKELEEALINDLPERRISEIIFQLSSPDTGKERFGSSQEMYCYNEKSNKESVLDKNLRARLYDKKGNLLSEDFLRAVYPDGDDSFRIVISYIPYHNEGYEIHIVNLKGENEVILEELSFQSQEELREESIVYDPLDSWSTREWWQFDEEDECHISPSH